MPVGMTLAFVAFLAGALLAVSLIAWWIIGPLDRAANRRRPVQFTMIDFFCLVFLVQLPMAAVHSLVPANETLTVWVLDAFGALACALLWWQSVARLSRADVVRVWQRSIFLTVVLPVACFGCIAFIFTSLMIVPVLFGGAGAPGLAGMLIVESILLGSFYLAGWFTRYIIKSRASHSPAASPE
jgi:hypothetical protein